MDEDYDLKDYAITKLSHRRTAAATTILFKMHSQLSSRLENNATLSSCPRSNHLEVTTKLCLVTP